MDVANLTRIEVFMRPSVCQEAPKTRLLTCFRFDCRTGCGILLRNHIFLENCLLLHRRPQIIDLPEEARQSLIDMGDAAA